LRPYSAAKERGALPDSRHSPVNVFAVADAEDLDGVVAAFAKGEAPVADAEAVAGRLESVKLLHVAGFCFQEPGELLSR